MRSYRKTGDETARDNVSWEGGMVDSACIANQVGTGSSASKGSSARGSPLKPPRRDPILDPSNAILQSLTGREPIPRRCEGEIDRAPLHPLLSQEAVSGVGISSHCDVNLLPPQFQDPIINEANEED